MFGQDILTGLVKGRILRVWVVCHVKKFFLQAVSSAGSDSIDWQFLTHPRFLSQPQCPGDMASLWLI
jgi:hypothetical protein